MRSSFEPGYVRDCAESGQETDAGAMSGPDDAGFLRTRAGVVVRGALVLAMLCLCWCGARSVDAQGTYANVAAGPQNNAPTLQQRPSLDDTPAAPTRQDAPSGQGHHPSTLPKDVSGAYAFDHEGESIEIDIDRGKLGGYITRLGDEETDRNTPLTYFFDHTELDGDQLRFETKMLHGVWYSFQGTVVRGPGQQRTDEGYYVLQGDLQTHHSNQGDEKSSEETVEERKVHFRSLGQ